LPQKRNVHFSLMPFISLFVWLWLVVNDRKFLIRIVFFSHTNQSAVFLHEPATKRTSQPNRLHVASLDKQWTWSVCAIGFKGKKRHQGVEERKKNQKQEQVGVWGERKREKRTGGAGMEGTETDPPAQSVHGPVKPGFGQKPA